MDFGPYQLLGEIARGGMAEVQYAVRRDTAMAPVVALKRILPQFVEDASFRRFFAAEAQLSLALRHEHVVRTLDAGEVAGQPYLALEYLHGRALNRVLHALALEGKKLPLPYGVHLAVKVLEGIHHVHEATDASNRPLNAVLCDVSPSNIMIAYDGRLKLIDFGIATSNLKLFDQIGLLKGKKTYMAPEQLRGLPLDRRADLYAMGICLVEFLSGRPLFAARSEFEVEEMVRTGALPPLPERTGELPAALQESLRRALSFDPRDRHPTAEAFAAELRPFARLGKGSPIQQADLARVLSLYVRPFIAQDDQRLAEALARAGRAPQGTA
jgi:serine/threonine protein kinase